MVDVQNQSPENEIELEKVGVKGLRKYLIIERSERTYPVTSTINCFVKLPSESRGAHMSRFAESVDEVPPETDSIENFAEEVAKNVQERHEVPACTEVFGEIPFQRKRPSGKEEKGIAKMLGEYSTENDRKWVGVTVKGALACPCSKELCDGRTHNQRGELTVKLDVSKNSVELFDVIDMCAQSFSAPLFTTLKRPEEKEIVEEMHQNPRFVEDVVRKCVQLLRNTYSDRRCKVECTSFESIHDHDTYSEWKGEL